MTISFTVYGAPVGKARARTVFNGGHAHSYTPAKTANFERQVAWACKNACKGAQMPENAPLRLDAVFYMPIPKSVGKRLRERLRWHTKKPDLDNLCKSLIDGANGIAYRDDNQIAALRAKKVYGEEPRVEVTIQTIEG